MAIPKPKVEAELPGVKKSDRVSIMSRDLTPEDLDMLDADIPEEAKALNHLYPDDR